MNAKELILSKINAGPDLAGTYLTMVMQGIPFSDIAKFMTSPVINAVVKKANGNIFTGAQSSIESSIKLFSEGVNPFDYFDFKEVLAISLALELGKKERDVSYREFFKDVNLEKLRELNDVSVTISYGNAEMGDFGVTETRNLAIKVNKFADALEHRKTLIKLTGVSEKEFMETLETFAMYKSIAEETELAGRRLGINQGMKGTLYDLYKFDYNFNNFLFKKFSELDDFNLNDYFTTPDETINNLVEFCDIKAAHLKSMNGDHRHRDALIKAYDAVRSNFNIVEAEFSLPQINAMLDAAYQTTKTFEASAKYRAIQKSLKILAEKQFGNSPSGFTYAYSELEIKRISRFFDNLFITNFLELLDMSIEATRYFDNMVKNQKPYKGVISLNNASDKANYKKTFEEDIIFLLRKDFPSNSFLANLIPEDNINMITGSVYQKIRMTFDTSQLTESKENHGANSSPAAMEYESLKQDLINIKDIVINGKPFIYHLELYNILLNNNNYGDNTFTRILNDIMKVDDNFKNNSLSLQYMDYVAKLESFDLLEHNDTVERLMLNLAYKKDSMFKEPDGTRETSFPYKYVKQWDHAANRFKIQIYNVANDRLEDYRLENSLNSDDILDSFLTSADLAGKANKIIENEKNIRKLKTLIDKGYIRIITNC